MTLAFYKVNNSQDYDRHTFDSIYDKPEEIVSMLKKLKYDEVVFYDISTTSTTLMWKTLGDFIEDYNDEMLDGGWWTVLIP